MPEVTTTLTQVKPFSGVSAKGPWTKTVFTDQNGTEFATFKGDVASVAQGFINVPATISYMEEQKGQYTNRTLLAIVAASNGSVPHAEVATPQAAATSQEVRELRIMRQSGLDRALTAFAIAGQDPIQSLEELYQLSDQFIDYFVNGGGE